MPQIQLPRNVVTHVDEQDYEMLRNYRWCLCGGYAYNAALGKMHRVIIGAPKGLHVDHIDGDPLNNRRTNLRFATNAQNQMNRHKVVGASKFKGVAWQRRVRANGAEGGHWVARIVLNGKMVHLGSFNDETEAAAAYNAAAIREFGEFAHLNDLQSTFLSARAADFGSRPAQINKRGASKYKGVTFDGTRGKWMAQLGQHLKQRFNSEIEAARAYNIAAQEFFGPGCVLNQI